MTATHLVIADDHPLFRDALRQAVASVVTSAKIDEAGSFEELTALLDQDSDVDLVLLDLTMPGISGFSGLIYLRAQFPAIPVVIVSASDDGGTIRQSLDFGASGFIPKRFGVARSLMIARVMHVIMIALLIWLAASFALPWPAWVGIAVVAGMLVWEHSMVSANDLSRLNAAFFTVNGYISLLFLLFWGAAIALAT